MGKPIILYTYDLEEYRKYRGFYLDPEETGFPVCKTMDEVSVIISTGELDDSAAKAFADKYITNRNGNARKIAESIAKML
jgi:CDP-ribitol ribitolphosphotransferase